MGLFDKSYHPPGTSPGTLRAPEHEVIGEVHLRLAHYTPDAVQLREHVSIEDCIRFKEARGVTWLNITGTPDFALLREIGEAFGLHNLALEDVLNVGQRPKLETYDSHLFTILRCPRMDQETLVNEQISLFLGADFVISICSGNQHPFRPVYDRLRKVGSTIRNRGADYLAYALIDTVVDQAFPVLEELGELLEAVESEVVEQPQRDTLARIHWLRRELLLLRRALWPQREVVNNLLRNEHQQMEERTLIYLRDCYDHCVQVLEMVESYREMVTGMLDVYLSNVSNRLNQTMRVLTVIATIFIPLTFIVGVYGMNFDRQAGPWAMPELGWSWGYPITWAVMIGIAIAMLVAFKRKGWF